MKKALLIAISFIAASAHAKFLNYTNQDQCQFRVELGDDNQVKSLSMFGQAKYWGSENDDSGPRGPRINNVYVDATEGTLKGSTDLANFKVSEVLTPPVKSTELKGIMTVAKMKVSGTLGALQIDKVNGSMGDAVVFSLFQTGGHAIECDNLILIQE